ncbi:GGDEF domain-containing protein, partial [Vibrio parahaemolyticus]|uniref:ABC transporter substrate-binding protein n=2 Tax=Vibrio TaxID=662 RepID=UPI0017BCF523|nr:GGDEF domain-containing protein [Vibrio parahaemolyticus]NMS02680.1 GGDEF domain-containing protein [Vibrio parahaemolyticus]
LAPIIKDTPVIFNGINNYHPSLHRSLNATGVMEDVDLEANLALIERLHPNYTQVLIVSDHSVTGEVLRYQIDNFVLKFPQYRDKIVQLVPDSIIDLKQQVAKLSSDKVVLFWTYYRDKQGMVGSERDWVGVNKVSNAPLFMVHDIGLGHGAVGGVIQSGYRHGIESAEMLEFVLDNPDQPLPAVKKSDSEIKLDYQAVARWGLGAEQEVSAVFFNKPMKLSERFAKEIRLFGSLFVVMSVVILLMGYYLQRMRRSESAARESQAILESIFDQSMQYMGILDANGVLKSGNDHLQSLLYHQGLRLDR